MLAYAWLYNKSALKFVKIDKNQLSKIYRVSESMLNLKVISEIPKRKSMKIV